MNPILVIREEILCLVILLYIIYNSRMYKMGKDQGNFLRICFFGVGHVIFDIITVLTVNRLDSVPPAVNWACHIIFYLFALLYSYEFFCYIIALCFDKEALRRARYWGLVPMGLYVLALPFLPMTYLTGNGTNYSFGPAAIVGYGVAMVFFVASIVVVLKYRKVLDAHIVRALLPMLGASIAAEVVQIAVPEALFTGGTVTIITVGFFFSLENPVAVLRQKVLFDALTGVKSRHSYEADIAQMEEQYAQGMQFGMVFCDINGLKAINDTRGHLEGDAYIGMVAQTLMRCLRGAEAVYRMGGDEFLAVYRGKNVALIERETQNVHAACEELSRHQDYEVSVAIGSALSGSEYKTLRDVLHSADFKMYSDKARRKTNQSYRTIGEDTVNVTALTDRVFEALADAGDNRFLFATNLDTKVTRWSRTAVEYFGLPGEYVAESDRFLAERIHPEDRSAFLDEIEAIRSGTRKRYDVIFRIRNAGGDYAACACTGMVLDGGDDEPSLYAGSMTVQNADESIDEVTDLLNGYEMIRRFDALIRSHTPAALMQLSILNLNSINMLYGYECGNDILRQFAVAMRAIVGGEASIFRTDGTKFVICVPGLSREGLADIYRKISRAAEHRIHIDSLKPPLQIAAGAFMLEPDFAAGSSVLRSNLIYAHTQSKYGHRGRLMFCDGPSAALSDSIDQNRLMLSIHQDAITDRKGFFMLYQPIVCAATGRIVGAEALLRWSSDSFSLVSPDSFIPWLEGDPCFFQLGNWILKEALEGAGQLLAIQPEFVVNINIALPQLEHERFRDCVLEILAQTGFPADHLCLEMTERCREMDVEYLKQEIGFFREHGIRIALDDLGTGFSSFGLLLSLNVDEIKLDHAFVKEIETKPVNQILTRMLVDASTSMGYTTCLEGVEDDALCRYLSSYGATYYQGFYCAKPMILEEFIPFVSKWNANRA